MISPKTAQTPGDGRLPAVAPLANPYVPFQLEYPVRYEARKALIRGTLYPGLDLPLMGIVNQNLLPVTPLSEIQALAFAIALACEPKLLIADEPTTALDVTIQAQILELMMELKDKLGMAIIMITHDLGIVASMCDRIAVMYAGRIVETGTCDEIFYHPKHEYTKGLLESIPRLDSTKHEKLIPIEGNPVDLLNPPEGCAFAPRCKNCMKICLRENPPKTDFSETHYAHCFMNQKAEMEGGNTNE